MRPFRVSASTLAAAIGLCTAGESDALGIGDKGSFSQIEASLLKERQVEIARATYILDTGDPVKTKTLCVKFTINASGDAYILLSDSMDDDTAHLEMVYSKLRNSRAYDPHDLGSLPKGVSPRSNLANFIRHGAASRDGVMLHGQAVKKQADGTETTDGLMTVMANVVSGDNPAVNNTVTVLITSSDDIPHRDKFVAFHLKYRP